MRGQLALGAVVVGSLIAAPRVTPRTGSSFWLVRSGPASSYARGCLLLPPAITGALGFGLQARVHPRSLGRTLPVESSWTKIRWQVDGSNYSRKRS
jgi:hypothetical protein